MRKLFSYLVVFAFGAIFASASRAAQPDRFALFDNMAVLAETFRVIRDHHLAPPADRDVIAAGAKGMAASLDPNSSYLTQGDYARLRDDANGRFTDIGFRPVTKDGRLVVDEVTPDTAAERAGLRVDDRIVAIDGVSTDGLSMETARRFLTGPDGAVMRLGILRKADIIDVTVLRENVAAETVRIDDRRNRPVLGVRQFSNTTPSQLRAAIRALGDGAHDGVILDLRGNRGGVLQAGVAVADLFLDGGAIVDVNFRDGDGAKTIRHAAKPGDVLNGASLVILIDRDTASTAEMVAAALQDQGRATVMGEPSFGKDTVQALFPLLGGEAGAVRLTVARYERPSGRAVRGRGVIPDGGVPTPGEADSPQDPVLAAALDRLAEGGD